MAPTLSPSPLPALAPRSWWLDEALAHEGPVPATPALAGRHETDVAIVGGGFTGLWTALALKSRSPGLRIRLIEAQICGAGASGKNGGKAHGYWASLGNMSRDLGPDAALQIARAGTKAQDILRAFATVPGRDVWWREGGNLLISASSAQDGAIARIVAAAERLGAPDSARALTPKAVAGHIRGPVFRGGVFLEEGATVHPARLARALRAAVLAAGVELHENTPMLSFHPGTPNRIRCAKGEILAREVVLATNVALAGLKPLRPHVSVFSSYAMMTDAAPDALRAMGWDGNVGLADLRMFLHYFRKTPDGRVLMGTGSGPIAYGGNPSDPAMTGDAASARRAEAGLRRLLPDMAATGVAKVWGGAIEVASDRLPMIGTLPGSRIHYACGYSGHGVTPTCLAGQILASLVTGARDEWSSSPLVTRRPPRLPPEPFRTLGGRLVRRAILSCEEAEDKGYSPPRLSSAMAALPRLLGMRIGTR